VNIKWTIGAKKNLEQIYNFIIQDNLLAAQNTIQKILNAINIIEDNPNIGRNGRVVNTRELIIPNTPYLIIYRITNTIEILRIFHSAMQLK
jgi:addiction module RelE/StbE family toxin